MDLGLDLDLMGLGARARELFGDAMLRAYEAAIIGRLDQRAPYGSHRGPTVMFVGTPVRVALNDSRDRAYLVTVDFVLDNPVAITPSVDAGGTSFVRRLGFGNHTSHLLLPGEQLFVTALAATNVVIIAQEIF